MADDVLPKDTGSILTPTQREQLRVPCEDEKSEDAKRMTRSRIRERLGVAILDLSTILDNLPHEDLDRAFTDPITYNMHGYIPSRKIDDAIGVLYLGSVAKDETLGATGLETIHTDSSIITTPLLRAQNFALRAEKGITRALTRRGVAVNDVDVSIDIDVEGELSVGERDLSEIPYEELKQLRQAGKIDMDEYDRAIEQRLEG